MLWEGVLFAGSVGGVGSEKGVGEISEKKKKVKRRTKRGLVNRDRL